jgi:hypothetical protein
MAINETQGRFNTGRDCTIVLIHPAVGQVQLDNVTNFEAKQETATLKIDRLDGVQLNAELPKGWTGSMEVARGSNSLDMLMSRIEALWLDTGSYGVGTMFQYINEADGSTTTFSFDNVAIKLDDAGSWKSDSAVTQKLTFHANRRRPV